MAQAELRQLRSEVQQERQIAGEAKQIRCEALAQLNSLEHQGEQRMQQLQQQLSDVKWVLWQAQADAMQQTTPMGAPFAAGAGGGVEGVGDAALGYWVSQVVKVPQSSSSSCRLQAALLLQEQQDRDHFQQHGGQEQPHCRKQALQKQQVEEQEQPRERYQHVPGEQKVGQQGALISSEVRPGIVLSRQSWSSHALGPAFRDIFCPLALQEQLRMMSPQSGAEWLDGAATELKEHQDHSSAEADKGLERIAAVRGVTAEQLGWEEEAWPAAGEGGIYRKTSSSSVENSSGGHHVRYHSVGTETKQQQNGEHRVQRPALQEISLELGRPAAAACTVSEQCSRRCKVDGEGTEKTDCVGVGCTALPLPPAEAQVAAYEGGASCSSRLDGVLPEVQALLDLSVRLGGGLTAL